MRVLPRERNEDGASLIIALLFVTTVSLVSTGVLTFADSSIRTTVVLRDQASDAYAADGAAKIAVNALRTSSPPYTNATGQSCLTGGALLLPSFPSASAGSAYVTCAPDPASGSGSAGPINASNTPANALLALNAASPDEAGIKVLSTTTGSDAFQTQGSAVSNSTIYTGTGSSAVTNRGTLTSTSSIVGKYGPRDPAANAGCFGPLSAPVITCATATATPDPGYPPPVADQTVQRTSCAGNGKLVTLSPGLYTSATALSACDNNTLWFKPGVYYFDFGSTSPTWTVNAGSIVGGTPTATLSGANPAIPGSCVSPLTPTGPDTGVEFVFAGLSRLQIGGTAKVELCGQYSATSPPIAVYGLKTAVGSASAQTGCIIAYTGCAVISPQDTQLRNVMYVQGTVYAPLDLMNTSFGQSGGMATGQYIADGAIVRSYSTTLSGVSPVGVSVPTYTPGSKGAETGVFLQVYLCASSTSCSAATGTLRLEATVGISTPAGSTAQGRTVSVYSWAVQR
jgi:hypothetical protein